MDWQPGCPTDEERSRTPLPEKPELESIPGPNPLSNSSGNGNSPNEAELGSIRASYLLSNSLISGKRR